MHVLRKQPKQQVVLLRRKKCIECYREEIDATQSRLRRFMSSMSIPIGQRERDREGPECSHCPSRGKTFYDPKGEDGEPQPSTKQTQATTRQQCFSFQRVSSTQGRALKIEGTILQFLSA